MNQFINFFWTIICFAPVLTYLFRAFDLTSLIAAVLLSLASLFIPSRKLQLSLRPKFYEKIGVRFIKKFVQNGNLANRSLREKDQHYKLIRNGSEALRYSSTIAMYERFHFLCLTLFIITSIFAYLQKFYLLSILVVIANIIYNICLILLQQYNKARLSNICK